MLRLLALFLICLGHSTIGAQPTLSANTGIGRVIKHKSGLTFDIPDRAVEATLRYSDRVSGSKLWHHYWGMPTLSHMYQFVHYGDQAVLGSVHAIMRGLDLPIYERGRLQATLQLYAGVGYITKTFDYIDNPTNNAVGSSINNATRLGVDLQYSMTNRWNVATTAHLLHTSNGLTTSPNSGINSWGASVGLRYQLEQKTKSAERPTLVDTSYRKWVGDLQVHYGRTEHAVPNGPKYPHYVISAGLGHRYHSLLTALVGLDYEYAGRAYAFHFRDFDTKAEALSQAQRIAIWVAHEFAFDRVVIRPQLGWYTDAFHDSAEPFYIKMGVHYQVVRWRASDLRVGIVLKSHEAVADHLSLVIGCRL